MIDKLKVEGHSHLYRDVNSGAVINSNRDEYDRYMKAKNKRQNMSNEINILRQELDEIKELLRKITNGN